MEIMDYTGVNDVMVRFFNGGHIVHTSYRNFKVGSVKSPYDKTVEGIGYWGVGEYSLTDEKGEMLPRYYTWKSMLSRCYNEKYHKRRPTYIDCIVYEEWHNYQNFAKWYEENYYEIDGSVMHLDKDILVKGNKIYSPEKCVFVPSRINDIFTKSRPKISDLPVGITINKGAKNKYLAQCSTEKNKSSFLGHFLTLEEAFNTYKTFKEKHIKRVADEYKDKIPQVLYETMYNYEVEPTD